MSSRKSPTDAVLFQKRVEFGITIFFPVVTLQMLYLFSGLFFGIRFKFFKSFEGLIFLSYHADLAPLRVIINKNDKISSSTYGLSSHGAAHIGVHNFQ